MLNGRSTDDDPDSDPGSSPPHFRHRFGAAAPRSGVSDLRIRVARTDDAAAIADVYRPYVEETAVTFDETAPDADAMAAKLERTLATYPWFVAERDGEIVGYAYASALRERPAYRWSVELSVYVDRAGHGEGVGSALYRALLETLDRQGYASAYAVLTLPNPGSVGFHEALGFERVGRFPEVGFKHGTWHDVAWYERDLGGRPGDPADPTPFADCRGAAWLAEALSTAASGGEADG